MTSSTILIVEDERIVALDLQLTLSNLGYDVVGVASSSDEAFALLSLTQPNLVMMDIHLGDKMDGIEIAQIVRQKYDIPVVYLTAYADDTTLRRAQETEPDGYLVKPFQHKDLRATVEMALFKHQMNKKLRESEERYRTLFETMTQGVVHQNAAGQITAANPAAERILGLTLDQMQGRTSMDSRWLSIKENGEPFPGDEHPAMVALRTGDKVKDVIMGVNDAKSHDTRWITIDAVPLFKPGEKKPYQVYTVFSDITERKHAQDALRSSEMRFRSLIDSLTMIVFIYQDGELVYVNSTAEEVTGYQKDELLQRGFSTIMQPVTAAEIEDREAARFAGNEGLEPFYEIALVTKSGEERWFHISLIEMEFEGKPSLLGTALDVTERRHVENQRLQLALEKERVELLAHFINRASHEFRTPLSVINVNTHLLKRRLGLENDDPNLMRIEEQVENITKLVTALIMMSGLESGQHLVFKELDLNQALRSAASALEPQLQDRSQSIDLDLCAQQIHVYGDMDSLRQAFSNILENASRFSPGDQVITVRSNVVDGETEIEIIDQGEGISTEHLPHIFERFYRADEAGTTRGFGLGLSMAKTIIEHHRGRIEVYSAPDQGSTFTVILPLYDRRPNQEDHDD